MNAWCPSGYRKSKNVFEHVCATKCKSGYYDFDWKCRENRVKWKNPYKSCSSGYKLKTSGIGAIKCCPNGYRNPDILDGKCASEAKEWPVKLYSKTTCPDFRFPNRPEYGKQRNQKYRGTVEKVLGIRTGKCINKGPRGWKFDQLATGLINGRSAALVGHWYKPPARWVHMVKVVVRPVILRDQIYLEYVSKTT